MTIKSQKKPGIVRFYLYWIDSYFQALILGAIGFAVLLLIALSLQILQSKSGQLEPIPSNYEYLLTFPVIVVVLLLLFIYQSSVFYDSAHPETL